MTIITAEQARNASVFVINFKGEVEETTLFDHIMESAEETTSPRGVEHKLFITESWVSKADDENDGHVVWNLKKWQAGGKSQFIDRFDSEEAAEEAKFQRIWKYDFMTDDQRDTMYWNTREEAELELANRQFMQDENFDPFNLG